MELHQPSVQEPLNETPKKTLEATVESLNNSPPPTDSLQSFPLTSPSLPPHPPSSDDNAGEERGGRVDRRETKPSSSDISVSGSLPSVEPVTDLEKKLRRAERFGMPVQLSEEEKRSSRAERFGVGSASIGKKNTGKLEEEKRKARAERFGLTGQSPVDEEVKKKARLARFEANPKPITPEEEEKRKARTLRFSGTSNAASETIGKANSELKAAVAETGGA